MRFALALLILMGGGPALAAAETASLPAKPAQSQPSLDALYDRLAKAKTQEEADGLVNLINRDLMKSGSDTADLMMSRAMQAMSASNNALAIELLSATLKLYPDYTEAWNKRATVFFFEEDYRRSLADVAQVLKREPRHLGALMGMGMMLQQMDDKKNAYAAFKRVLEVNPFSQAAKKATDELKKDVEGEAL